MARLTSRVLAVLVCAALASAPATSAQSGHSPLVSVASVRPPPSLHRAMRWSHTSSRPAGTAAFAGGRATVGLAGRGDGRTLAHALGLRVVDWLPRLRLVEVAGAPATLASLASSDDARIRYVEPIVTGRSAHARNDPLTTTTDPATGVPYEWEFHALGADLALNLTHGSAGILVGVVDSGVAPVPDLTGKIAETFWDPTAQTSAIDVIGHGTFVSSLIAARNDDGFGLAGFCGACRLAVYKADPLTDVQVAEGIQKLTDAHVRVINLSIVLNRSSQDVMDALDYAANAGVLVVAAAGNDGSGSVAFPASAVQPPNGAASRGLAVGASDEKDARASFSNTGPQLSLLAPGTFNSTCTLGIPGAIPANALELSEGNACRVRLLRVAGTRYAYDSGTSFSAAEVSGIAALVWSLKPSLTSAQVVAVLEQTATRPTGSGWNPATGWGVVNARAAVESVAGSSAADAIVLSKLAVSRPRRAGSHVVATVDASWSDGAVVGVGARPSCRITLAGSAIRASVRLRGGVATCGFDLPKNATGKRLSGTVSVVSAGVPQASADFRFAAASSS